MNKIIAFPHKASSHGGPGSFQTRLIKQLEERNWQIVYPEDKIQPDVILVVGGTKKLNWLSSCKKKGSKIVHRLDGLNWQHKLMKTSFKESFLANVRNKLFKNIRNNLADYVIYQSEFIKNSWHTFSGSAKVTETVIHNSVDLNEFNHIKPTQNDKYLVCVEGAIHPHEAYTTPLIHLAKNLYKKNLIASTNVCGDITSEYKNKLIDIEGMNLKGRIPREEIKNILRNSLYLVLEVHPPCPNSVIEALASGIPVVGYDTGSLKELIGDKAGITVPYGADSWKLETPDLQALQKAAETILENYDEYAKNARLRAEKMFDINQMVKKYLKILDCDK